MAYTQVQVIADTERRHVVKRINSGNTESAALVVNAAALSYAVLTITTAASSNTFKIGEIVTTSNGAGSATVQDVINATAFTIVNITTGAFNDTGVITGATSQRSRTQSGSPTADTYNLNVSRILYDIKGQTGAEKVTLLWEGTGGDANNRTIAILGNSGVLELDTHAARINNNANTPTGNILVTTDGWDANAHYTLILDVSKREGYAGPRSVYGV